MESSSALGSLYLWDSHWVPSKSISYASPKFMVHSKLILYLQNHVWISHFACVFSFCASLINCCIRRASLASSHSWSCSPVSSCPDFHVHYTFSWIFWFKSRPHPRKSGDPNRRILVCLPYFSNLFQFSYPMLQALVTEVMGILDDRDWIQDATKRGCGGST